MSHKMILFFVIFSCYFTKIRAMEPTPRTPTLSLEQLNKQATALYEQAFFCELLLSIIGTRRKDEFTTDVLEAQDKVYESSFSSLRENSLGFSDDIGSYKKLNISHLYHTFDYLIKQKTYAKLKYDCDSFADKSSLSILHTLIQLLAKFEKSDTLNERLLLARNYTHIMNPLILYHENCNFLRKEYQGIIAVLREQVKVNPKLVPHLFHAYLQKPLKILPTTLTSPQNREPSFYSIDYVELYDSDPAPEESIFCLTLNYIKSKFQKKPDSPSPSIYVESIKEPLYIGSLLFVYDFLDHWIAKIKNKEDLQEMAQVFLNSYTIEKDRIDLVARQSSLFVDPDKNLPVLFDTCQVLKDSFTTIKEHSSCTETSIANMEEAIKCYLSNRLSPPL